MLGTDGRSLVQLLFRVPSGWFFMTLLMFLIAVSALNGAFFQVIHPSVRMFICVCMHTYVHDVHAYIFVWAEAFFNWLAVDV